MPEIIEQLESRMVSSSGGRGQGSRTFICSGYTGPDQIISKFGSLVGSTSVPGPGASFPDLRGLVARDFNLNPIAGHNDLWRLDWKYEQVSTSYFSAPTVFIKDLPNEVGYTELSSEIRAEFVPTFRTGDTLTIPNQGEPGEPDYGNDDDPDNDIAGKPIDAAGNPVSTIRRIQELTLTEIVNQPDWNTYQTFRFTRNNRAFQGAPAGHVLYRGASVRRTGLNVYTVSHQFIYDELFHMQQAARLDQEGRPMIDPNRFAGEHAAYVYWIQPFTELLDHNSISTNF